MPGSPLILAVALDGGGHHPAAEATDPFDARYWARLAEMSPETLFIWGRQDQLVPIAFMKHVERALPAARHLELDCGHVPQLEAPKETHRAIREFFAER